MAAAETGIHNNKAKKSARSDAANVEYVVDCILLFYHHRKNHVNWTGDQVGELDPDCQFCKPHMELKTSGK
ncbi:hypothetical protein Ngar_c16730 [Candidatus Nitrososphaera gargensis Ga9.2]|uniref:Uncharacterized protein n=1 Tax=Nitrososphaera gargensis (strain Ga9.2) TaxID=1237085 RepID=K0IBD1_NITGG|nr:hypothetical protein Ngar_c16730 [Candidatus Nitrososphaera gargensis Ga9.2]